MNLDFVKKESLNNKDILDLYEIHNEVFLEYDKMSFDNFKNEFFLDNRFYIAVKSDNNFIGYAGVINCIDCFEIIGIGVKTNYQKMGIGTLLLSKIIDEAKRQKIDKLFLEVDEKNLKAQNFYRKNNFVLTNIRKKYYKDNDAYIFVREI